MCLILIEDALLVSVAGVRAGFSSTPSHHQHSAGPGLPLAADAAPISKYHDGVHRASGAHR